VRLKGQEGTGQHASRHAGIAPRRFGDCAWQGVSRFAPREPEDAPSALTSSRASSPGSLEAAVWKLRRLRRLACWRLRRLRSLAVWELRLLRSLAWALPSCLGSAVLLRPGSTHPPGGRSHSCSLESIFKAPKTPCASQGDKMTRRPTYPTRQLGCVKVATPWAFAKRAVRAGDRVVACAVWAAAAPGGGKHHHMFI
jgi:hypothetical protein